MQTFVKHAILKCVQCTKPSPPNILSNAKIIRNSRHTWHTNCKKCDYTRNYVTLVIWNARKHVLLFHLTLWWGENLFSLNCAIFPNGMRNEVNSIEIISMSNGFHTQFTKLPLHLLEMWEKVNRSTQISQKPCKPIAFCFSFWHESKVFDLILVSKFEKRFAEIARVCCISHSNWANTRSRVSLHVWSTNRICVMTSNTYSSLVFAVVMRFALE